MDQTRSLGNGKVIARILLKPTKSFFFNLLKDAGTRAIIRNYELLIDPKRATVHSIFDRRYRVFLDTGGVFFLAF